MFAMLVFIVPANADEKPKSDAGGKVTASDSTSVKLQSREKTKDSKTPDAEKEEKSEEKEPAENLKPLESVKIESVDIVNFELMKKKKEYDKNIANKAQKYMAKLNRNIYAKIDQIRKLMLEDSWNLESVEIPNKPIPEEQKEETIAKKVDIKQIEPVDTKNMKDTYHKKVIEHKDSELETELNQLNDMKYIDVGIDIDKCSEPEKKAPNKLVTIETGARMSTATSVAVSRQMVNLKSLIIEYHAALLEYLKYKYLKLMSGIEINERALPKEVNGKVDEDNLTTKTSKIKKTDYIKKFEDAWKIKDWNKANIKLNLVDAFKVVREDAVNFRQNHLIDECDMKLVMSLEKIIGIHDELKKQTINGTFRAGWSEFDLGWVMFIFGVLTLYGGLTWTILIDFRSRKKAKNQ